jgi:ubiquinone/menaquinone biosynthesis C-methylase UbiE
VLLQRGLSLSIDWRSLELQERRMTGLGRSAESDAWRRTVLEIARALAPGWERQRARIEETVAPVREWMLRELAPRPGDTVLELAAGAGDTGFEAAAIAGEHGRLISTDASPEMVEVARRRGAELGLTHVDYAVLDAERIALDSDSVDGVLCRFAYMLMADPATALAETHRVLRPGGRIALSVWGAPERNPWATILAAALVERGHVPPPDPRDPGPFSMADRDRTGAILEGVGFGTVRTEEIPVRFVFRDLADYLGHATDTAGPFAIVLRELSGADRKTLGAQLEEAFAPFLVDRGIELPGLALCAAGESR